MKIEVGTELSKGQMDLYRSTGRIVLAVGAIRSGKTFAASLAFFDYSMRLEPRLHFVAGRSPAQLEQEVLPHLQRRAQEFGAKQRWDGNKRILHVEGHRFMLVSWTNKESEERFRGFTACNIFVDEAALVDPEFFSWLLTRMSYPESRMFACCNPEGPDHWLKAMVDDGRIDESFTLLFQDNPWLKPETIKHYEKQYPEGSLRWKRLVKGQWAAATGLVFNHFEVCDRPDARHLGTIAGIDFGMTAPTAVVRIEYFEGDLLWVSDAWLIEGTQNLAVMPSEQARRIVEWHVQKPFEAAFIDPSASPLRSELVRQSRFAVVKGNNDVSSGIAEVARRFENGTLKLGKRTQPLQNELYSYTWDTKKDDAPAKANDHLTDALRYAVHSKANQPVYAVI